MDLELSDSFCDQEKIDCIWEPNQTKIFEYCIPNVSPSIKTTNIDSQFDSRRSSANAEVVSNTSAPLLTPSSVTRPSVEISDQENKPEISNNSLQPIIDHDKILEVYQHLTNSRSREWTEKEDRLLIDYVEKYNSRNWKRISEVIGTKTAQQCTYRYQKLMNDLKSKKWSRKEDIKLYEMVETYGINFSEISKVFEGRSSKELEERYRKKLDPKLRNPLFTPDEDQLLSFLHKKLGNKWVQISRYFHNRDPETVKQRYFNYVKKSVNERPSVKSIKVLENSSSSGTKESTQSNSNLSGKGKQPKRQREKKSSANHFLVNKAANNSDVINNNIICTFQNSNNAAILENAPLGNNFKEFELIFKKKSYENINEYFEYDFLTDYKKSDSTKESSTVKSDFNVDIFFEVTGETFNIQSLYNTLLLNQKQEISTQGISSNNFFCQTTIYQEFFEKVIKYYDAKEAELHSLIGARVFLSDASREGIYILNSQLNSLKDTYVSQEAAIKNQIIASLNQPSNHKQIILSQLDLLLQLIHLAKVKSNFIQSLKIDSVY